MNIWTEIEKLAGQTLVTLDQRKPFDIVDVSNHAVIVRPQQTGIERKIPRDHIERAYKKLASIGQLTRSEIREEISNFNPAYVAAILTQLSNVNHSKRPIRLCITGKDL